MIMATKDDMLTLVGEEVTVDVVGQAPYDLAPKIATYKGIVMRSEHWDPAESFRLTGNKDFPVRVIALRRVKAINGLVQAELVKSESRIVRVPSSNGKSDYAVVLNPNGHHTCPCKGFGFRKSCSHIKQALEQVQS